MTEDEAKTKWCPHARSLVTLNGENGAIAVCSGNRFEGDNVVVCLASACMAWRWLPTSPHTVKNAKALADGGMKINAIKELRAAVACTLKEAKDIVEGQMDWPAEYASDQGFCGAFGRPQ